MKFSKPGGFTLIELLIAIVIVGIIAAVAYPSYLAQVQKTRRAEGQAALMVHVQILERCFTLCNVYNATCAADAPGACPPALPVDTENGHYQINYPAGQPTATGFRLQAVPRNAQASDSLCLTLTIDQTGARDHTGSAAQALDCW